MLPSQTSVSGSFGVAGGRTLGLLLRSSGLSVAVTPMCQGGGGATGGSRAAAANVLLVDAVPQQQCKILQQNDEVIIRQGSQQT